jgi:hypothetical protein
VRLLARDQHVGRGLGVLQGRRHPPSVRRVAAGDWPPAPPGGVSPLGVSVLTAKRCPRCDRRGGSDGRLGGDAGVLIRSRAPGSCRAGRSRARGPAHVTAPGPWGKRKASGSEKQKIPPAVRIEKMRCWIWGGGKGTISGNRHGFAGEASVRARRG